MKAVLGITDHQFFSNWVPRKLKGVSWFRDTEMRKDERVLLAVPTFYIHINIRVATFDTNHSVTDSTQSIAASIQKFPGLRSSVSRVRHRLSQRNKRNYQLFDQFEVSP
jgi:hypothetical protein